MVEINGINIVSNVYEAFVEAYGLYAFEKSVIYFTSEYSSNQSSRMLSMVENGYLLENASRSDLIDVIKLLTMINSNDLILDSDFVYNKYALDFLIEIQYDVNYDDRIDYLIRIIEERS